MILFPVLILELSMMPLFYRNHWRKVRYYMQDSVIDVIELILEEKRYNDEILHVKSKLHEGKFTKNNAYSKRLNRYLNDDLYSFEKALKNRLQNMACKATADGKRVKVEIEIDKNRYLEINFLGKKIKSVTTYIFTFASLVSAILLVTISTIFLKNQVRSIKKIIQNAEKIGSGIEVKDMKISGADEIRSAGSAILSMKTRMENTIKKRTEMLTYISHDLRTPLTRMKLLLESSTGSRKELIKEVDEMGTLIRNYLDFAKDEGNERPDYCTIAPLLKNIIKKYSTRSIKLNIKNDKVTLLRRGAINRALSNIIDNAVKFSNKCVYITLYSIRKKIIIEVEDDGKGIEKEMQDQVFEPFSKTNHSSGYGLGLAIARNIITIERGELLLSKSKYGGLKAKVILEERI